MLRSGSGRWPTRVHPVSWSPPTNELCSRHSLVSWLFGTQKAFPHRNRIIDGGLFPRPAHKNLFNAHAAEPGLAIVVPQAPDLPKPAPRSPKKLPTPSIHPEPAAGSGEWAESSKSEGHLQPGCGELGLSLKLCFLLCKQAVKSYLLIATPAVCWLLYLNLPKLSLILIKIL